MNEVARQVASQYRRDTMSPIMVSGVLRMVEFALLFLSGLCLYFHYVGFFNYLPWQYPLAIASASFLAVVLLDVYRLLPDRLADAADRQFRPSC